MAAHEAWQAAIQAAQSIITRQNAQTQAAVAELALPPSGVLLFYGLEFAPDPLSVARLSRRMPYTSPDLLERALNALQKDGWLVRAPKRAYALTNQAHDALAQILNVRQAELAGMSTLPENELHTIAGLLRRVVNAALKSECDVTGLRENRSTAIAEDSLPLALVVQHLSDLTTFREDCAHAAWRPLGIDGYVWEAFGMLARADCVNAEELAAKLSAVRGYDERTYAKAIKTLTERGWVEDLDGEAVITQSGEAVRANTETQIQTSFFSAWSVLSAGELTMLTQHLNDLHTAIQNL